MSGIASKDAALFLTALGHFSQIESESSLTVLQRVLSTMPKYQRDAVELLLHRCGSSRGDDAEKEDDDTSSSLGSHSADSESEFVYPDSNEGAFRRYARYVAEQRHKRSIPPRDTSQHPRAGPLGKTVGAILTATDMVTEPFRLPLNNIGIGMHKKHPLPREDYLGGHEPTICSMLARNVVASTWVTSVCKRQDMLVIWRHACEGNSPTARNSLRSHREAVVELMSAAVSYTETGCVVAPFRSGRNDLRVPCCLP